MSNQMLFVFLGGTLLLLYGVQIAGEGLNQAGEKQIKSLLASLTRNRFFALISGVILTFLTQSSSATTIMLVSLVDSGLLQVAKTMGIILGADIGTTITVQLISFKFHNYALGIVAIGLLIMFLSSKKELKALGKGILGFGLIFLSLELLASGMSPLKENKLFLEILTEMGEAPVFTILFSALLTALIQSSAVTIGLAISLSLNDLINLQTAIPIILGANIGTCGTALLASLRSKTEARQVAVAHILFKIIGVVIFYPFLGLFQSLVELSAGTVIHQIANAHTFFNVIIAFLFLPFTSQLYKLVQKLAPLPKEKEERFGPKYLNPELLSTPSLALASAVRETIRMAEIVQDMLALSIKPFMEMPYSVSELIEKIEASDDKVDILDREIRFYLTQLAQKALSEEEAKKQMEILSLIYNLESIGDVIDKNLMELAKKRARKEVRFSKEGEQNLIEMHKAVYENLVLALSAFTTRDETIAQQVIRNKSKIREMEQEFYQSHIRRLEQGCMESFETSRIHLDLLSNLRRINSYITNLAYPLVQKQSSEPKT